MTTVGLDVYPMTDYYTILYRGYVPVLSSIYRGVNETEKGQYNIRAHRTDGRYEMMILGAQCRHTHSHSHTHTHTHDTVRVVGLGIGIYINIYIICNMYFFSVVVPSASFSIIQYIHIYTPSPQPPDTWWLCVGGSSIGTGSRGPKIDRWPSPPLSVPRQR